MAEQFLLAPGTLVWYGKQPKHAPSPSYQQARVLSRADDGKITVVLLEGAEGHPAGHSTQEVTVRDLLLSNHDQSAVEV